MSGVDVSKINPFIEATCQVFNTMLKCTPKRGQVGIAKGESDEILRTAIIGLSGTMRGAVAIAFPSKTAHSIVKKLVQTDKPISDEEINDALGEIANVVAGCAKAKLQGHAVSISLPSIVRGEKYTIMHPKDSMTIAVPFESEVGHFTLNVTFSKADSQ